MQRAPAFSVLSTLGPFDMTDTEREQGRFLHKFVVTRYRAGKVSERWYFKTWEAAATKFHAERAELGGVYRVGGNNEFHQRVLDQDEKEVLLSLKRVVH